MVSDSVVFVTAAPTILPLGTLGDAWGGGCCLFPLEVTSISDYAYFNCEAHKKLITL